MILEHIQPSTPLSLYIHVPFCTTKCSYCAFYSVCGISKKDKLAYGYARCLAEELALVNKHRKTGFDTVFIGGGNPGILDYNLLASILLHVNENCSCTECTVEINPETALPSIGMLCDAGLTRLSLGIQSLDERFLQILGRNAGINSIRTACRMVHAVRIEHHLSLNCDLICCIPGQTVSDAISDIDKLVDIARPDHISLYSLSVEDGTKLARRVADGTLTMASESQQADILYACWDRLDELGYNQYEISNFAKPGCECRHNRHYWNLDAYLGLGPSAASTLFTEAGPVRWNADADVEHYADLAPFATYRSESLDKNQWMLERLLTGLRTADGIDEAFFQNDFGTTVRNMLGSGFDGLASRWPRCIASDSSHFSLTRAGWMVMDPLLVDLAVSAGL